MRNTFRNTLPAKAHEDLKTVMAKLSAAMRAHGSDPEDVLTGLSDEQIKTIGQAVLFDRIKQHVDRNERVSRIDLAAERNAWLACYSSKNTRVAYGRAVDILDAWCRFSGTSVLQLTAKDADDFILAERAKNRDADSVRLLVYAVSSLYSFLVRRYAFIKNPFRGSRALPKKTQKIAVIPTAEEVAVLADAALNHGDAVLHAAILVMAGLGLRVGGLSGLTIRGTGWTTRSKGKDVIGSESLSEELLKVLNNRGIRPFEGVDPNVIRKRFERLARSLQAEGVISTVFSVHDIRHFYAESFYRLHKDIFRLSRALGHSGIAITEGYLRNSLGIDARR